MQQKNSIRIISKQYYQYGAFFLLIAFATIQFFLILRHKSPYLSDSYFYKHIFYQLQGDSFQTARQKVIAQVDFKKADNITINFFLNEAAYKNSLSFFTKRPLYPILAYLVNVFTSSEYISFLVPVFLSYLGIVALVFYLSIENLSHLWTILITALFISFYPFLDWSTYFLTDSIGALFWLLQLTFAFKFVSSRKTKWFYLYLLTLIISLVNREQSLLMSVLFSTLYVFLRIFSFPKSTVKSTFQLLIVSITVSAIFILGSTILAQRSILDTIIYTQNNYGLYQNKYSLSETVKYIINAIKISHIAFIEDLMRHHWWLILFLLSVLALIQKIFFSTKKSLFDMMQISSGFASYAFIFIYPVLSYRYFYPLLFAIIYFCTEFIRNFEIKRESILNLKNYR